MSDLIDRQAVLEAFQRLCDVCGEGEKYNGIMCRTCSLDDGICIIEDMPSAEIPERKKGKWVERKVYSMTIMDYQHAKCSVCGKYLTTPYQYYFDEFKYCPNCGSEMTRGE
jgi:predicted RNA-binding Zn-ribbon protein involved in translation (DUF1610 family)